MERGDNAGKKGIKGFESTHGMSKTRIWASWSGMKTRCDNKNHRHYHRYGGRGITYCQRWTEFEKFYEDMGECPDRLTLDRVDNDGNYEPDNCRWASRKEQSNNMRRNKLLTLGSITKTLSEWADAARIDRKTLTHRLKKQKLPLYVALTRKVRMHRKPVKVSPRTAK